MHAVVGGRFTLGFVFGAHVVQDSARFAVAILIRRQGGLVDDEVAGQEVQVVQVQASA